MREMQASIRKEEKKYKKKLAKERKKHASMSKKEWKERVAQEDAKRAFDIKVRKREFEEKMENEKKEQLDLQDRRYAQLKALQKQKADERMAELTVKHAKEQKELEVSMQSMRIDLLARQHQEWATLVQQQFEKKRNFKAALHQERQAVLKQQHQDVLALAEKHCKEEESVFDKAEAKRLREQQKNKLAALRAEQEKERNDLAHAGKTDAAKILEAFQRLVETVASNQAQEMQTLTAKLDELKV